MRKNSIQSIHLPEVDSTNSLASRMLSDGLIEDWTVISADTQMKGRGQMETTWQDEQGMNALLSLVSPPIMWPVSRIFQLNMVVSLATVRALKPWVNAQIKWPNDLYVKGKKLGGFLIEPSIRGEYVQRLIIGLGLNVYQTQWVDHIPATSLSLETSDVPEPRYLTQLLAENIASSLQLLETTGIHDEEEYLQKCLGYQAWSYYTLPDGTMFRAKLIGVEPTGKQILLNEEGHRSSYGLKEIKMMVK